MGKIGRAVQGIDDPLPSPALVRARHAGFLRKNGVSGIPFENAANDKRFAFLVRDGHQVGSSLELDLLVAVHVVF